jgi:3-methylcrotonyl-CoA carboxylase alpha subunit
MKKVLVANRSEIACRVFQACREMGLGTVAIYAPGDEQARHVTYADQVEKVSSYLDVDAVIAAAQRSGAKLIHPGYGFLSERPAFVDAVEKAGLIFIGPTSDTMRKMGDKVGSKELAQKMGVPILPWAKVEKGGDLKAQAKKVGFPLLLKASAGGGGKGMRRVDREADLDAAAESAAQEAKSAFGDGTLFLEKLVEKPRHIEVQVFGDGRGGAIHLMDRECSLQRRHQKIWEEAPAPRLSDKTRNGLHEAALQLSKGVNYRSAGTLEFLVDADGEFYFLEMNARLQVEHPVTEQVTGVDLVHAQLQLALNPSSSPLKEAPPARGHSIEVRLYAEDPFQGFIPTPGTVTKLHWPTGTGIRVESGIEEGQAIGIQFDSMVAKLVVHAQDREQALARMRFALEETVLSGVGTNQAYLRQLCDHPAVKKAEVYTQFLEREFAQAAKPNPSEEELQLLIQATASVTVPVSASDSAAESFPSPWRTV